MKRSSLKVLSLLVVSVVALTACGTSQSISPVAMEKVRVQAGWLLNGEFANVCAGITEGYYHDVGLDVELIAGGPSGSSFIIATNAVAQDDSITLGIDSDLVALARGVTKENPAERLQVKAFAAFWNDYPYGFIVKKDSPLNSLKDFVQKKADGSSYKIGVTADSVVQNAIASAVNMPVTALDIVTVGFDAAPFLANQVDALAAFWTTQAYEVVKAGIPYRFLPASELAAYNQPSMVAIASMKTLTEKKETLSKWLKATIKGSEFVLANPDQAGKNILDPRCGGSKFDLTQEQWLVNQSVKLFDKERIGSLDQQQIENFSQAYYDLKQIPRVPQYTELVDDSILKTIYQ